MSEISMTMYVLVATAVYDQGVIGVYSTEEHAREVAGKIWPKTDGHHYFRIDVVTLGETYEQSFDYTWNSSSGWGEELAAEELAKRRGGREPHIEINHKSAPDV
jgi:hypothetical protein